MDIFPGRLYQEREIESNEGLREVVAIESNKCFRCGNTDAQLFGKMCCALCKREDCIYCRNCIVMGRVNSCKKIILSTSYVITKDKGNIIEMGRSFVSGTAESIKRGSH